MRIVQTFWTAGKSPLSDGFGWRFPEYHLMAWALSSIMLHKHYNDVVLYTDTIGCKILKNYLNLPYSEVINVYDA